jgi:hypothetical protein
MSRRCVALLIALSTAGLPAATVAQTAAPRPGRPARRPAGASPSNRRVHARAHDERLLVTSSEPSTALAFRPSIAGDAKAAVASPCGRCAR